MATETEPPALEVNPERDQLFKNWQRTVNPLCESANWGVLSHCIVIESNVTTSDNCQIELNGGKWFPFIHQALVRHWLTRGTPSSKHLALIVIKWPGGGRSCTLDGFNKQGESLMLWDYTFHGPSAKSYSLWTGMINVSLRWDKQEDDGCFKPVACEPDWVAGERACHLGDWHMLPLSCCCSVLAHDTPFNVRENIWDLAI